jgi:hypothetical protein
MRRRGPLPLALAAATLVVAAVTAASTFASASQLSVAPRQLGAFVVDDQPDVPDVLRVVASEDTWNNDRSYNSRHGNDPRLAIADGSQACLVIASATCTNVRNARSYVKFDLSALPSGATIESATIRMVGGPTTISSTPVTARRVTSSWSESTMTFEDRPSTSSSGVVTGTSVESGGTEVLTFDVRSAVAARGTATVVNGWELRPNGNNDSWWYSSEWGTASQRPTLTVVYR